MYQSTTLCTVPDQSGGKANPLLAKDAPICCTSHLLHIVTFPANRGLQLCVSVGRQREPATSAGCQTEAPVFAGDHQPTLPIDFSLASKLATRAEKASPLALANLMARYQPWISCLAVQ